MPTVKGVLQKYQEGQNIFRREAVACLVARIEQLEKFIASQQPLAPDGATPCAKCGLVKNHAVGCPELVLEIRPAGKA